MNYTKGDWEVKHRHGVVRVVVKGGKPEIADIIGGDKANAQLIAAAPDMYGALKLYIEHQEATRGHYCSVCHNEIEKAIAKASC